MRRFMAPAFQHACWTDNFEARSAARSVWVWFAVMLLMIVYGLCDNSMVSSVMQISACSHC